MLKNKKANFIMDNLALVTFMFMLAIIAVLSTFFVREINTEIQGMDEIPAKQKADVNTFSDGSVKFWDTMYLIMFVILVGAFYFTAWIIDTHPFYFIMVFFVMLSFTVITMLLHNTYFELFEGGDLGSIANEFTIIPFFMLHIVKIMIPIGFFGAVILYSKLSRGGV